jgi:peptide/nickel transport system permease protein
MLRYIARRFMYMLLLLIVVSIVSFILIQLPPGSYVDTLAQNLQQFGSVVQKAQLEDLSRQYGLDLPITTQYFMWIGNMFKGSFGMSFAYNRPVFDLILERLPLSILLSLSTLLVVYLIAIPVGIYSATHQYSLGDYAFSTIAFVGMAVPNFLLALILMYVLYKLLGMDVGGLFSMKYLQEPWSWGKFVDMLNHMWIPLVVIGTSGTAGLIRVLRGCLLDELRKAYVITARAKGLSERKLLFKYPVRIAINPLVSTIGWLLPAIVSGEAITSIVLSLPTTGPLLITALKAQDMYLAGDLVMFLCFLTLVGTFLSDILLAVVDPRIRLARAGK